MEGRNFLAKKIWKDETCLEFQRIKYDPHNITINSCTKKKEAIKPTQTTDQTG